jgi:hypothetical protein
VPYLPVTPTLRVRFVYWASQYKSEESLVGSVTIVVVLEDVEKVPNERGRAVGLIPSAVGSRGNYCHHLYSCG